ncbi:MAG: M13 family metallopeptidase [Myxococcales bacterium]|nr:M13 family metallopeptidase [Myxococcales bacterium]
MRKLAILGIVLACSTPKESTKPEATVPPSPANPPATAVTGAPGQVPNAAGQPANMPAPQPQPSAAARAPAPPPAGIDLSIIDPSVKPCDDFYRFACGKWLERTPIPEDRPLWGRAFSEILERNQALLKEIVEKDARGEGDPSDPYARKVGDFYATCMDEQKAETASFATLQEELRKIDAVKDQKSLARETAELQKTGARAFFGFGSRQDFKDATQVIGAVDQSGLGLPDRDYYFKDDKKSVELRALYLDHIGKMLELTGIPDSAGKAKKIMDLETRLAKASMDRVSRRDPNKTYHRLDRPGLMKTAPRFDWNDYFATIGAPDVRAINVSVPDFFKALDGIVQDLDDARTYLKWKAIEADADALGDRFVRERFRFNQALTGAKAILPRWKRCVVMTDRALGEALGRTFVTTTIGAEGKQLAKEMIQGIEKAFEANLATLDWMDDAAKKASLYKLHKIDNKVGYPEKWRDYSKLEIGHESLLANVLAAAEFETARDLAKIGKPVDRGEWRMTPPTVNAYYSGSLNEMVFPAGIMQLPFFSPEAPLPSNYGGLGMVMGHELTHGFDDQGRKFDGDGNLHEWWSPEVTKAFTERAECVAKQYDGYVAVEDVHLNGHLTLGENIGDIGGLKMMISALRASMGRDTQQKTLHVPGWELGPEQQAFIAFGQVWCTNYRPEAARTQALTNPHSTAQWRVNGPASDNPDFAKAFSCAAGSPMAPANRCTVW